MTIVRPRLERVRAASDGADAVALDLKADTTQFLTQVADALEGQSGCRLTESLDDLLPVHVVVLPRICREGLQHRLDLLSRRA